MPIAADPRPGCAGPHTVTPGTGPHAASLRCQVCQAVIRGLKERRLMINNIFLLGTLASEIEVPFSDKEPQAVSARTTCWPCEGGLCPTLAPPVASASRRNRGGPPPGQGVSSMVKWGLRYGLWRGIFATLLLPHTLAPLRGLETLCGASGLRQGCQLAAHPPTLSDGRPGA
jgi:hypothetical protein